MHSRLGRERSYGMVRFFKTEEGRIREQADIQKDSWVMMTDPTSKELEMIATRFQIDVDDLRAPLDEEERSRIEVEDNYTLVLVDIPMVEERNGKDWYVTVPLGIVMTSDTIITVCLHTTPILEAFLQNRVKEFHSYMKTRFILQILYRNASLYLQYLRNIERKSSEIEQKLHISPKNRELIELFELEKSLVYFTTSLRANEVVLEKLLKTERVKKYPEDEELLEDVIIENKQAIEMVSIYSGILSGTMDAFASVISNNLNNVMRFLSVVTIVMSVPTMIASFYGMNVNNTYMPFVGSPYAFPIVVGISVFFAAVVALCFAKRR